MDNAWSPLRHALFRTVWIAAVASNIGAWMHDVGRAWLMTSLAPSPLMVALVSTAGNLPTFLIGVPAGALADVLDRRRLLLASQLWMAAMASVMGILALYHALPAWGLLLATFLLGLGSAINTPAWLAAVPEMVPRQDLGAAVALNSAGFNLARAVGPALGGLVVAAAGPGAVFLLNAISFLIMLVALYRWRPAPQEALLHRPSLGVAMRSGLRYLGQEPQVQAIVARMGLFLACASGVMALLPLVARTQLHSGPNGYGLLMGCMGAGAVLGALILPRLRRRLDMDGLAALATVLWVVVAFSLSTLGRLGPACLLMLMAGVAWLTLLASLSTRLQLLVPGTLRGRVLSIHLLVSAGSMAGGSALWGAVAVQIGIPGCLRLVAGGLFLTLLAGRWFPLRAGEGLGGYTAAATPAAGRTEAR